jgi:magnesium chelatase family protein
LDHKAERSETIRSRVEAARARQLERAGKPNQALTTSELDRTSPLDEAARHLMSQALQRLGLSARAYHRVLEVAPTIADLAGSERIETTHLSEAIGYRRLDRAGH